MRAVFAAALVLMLPSAEACAQDTNITRTVTAGHETTIGYAQRWTKDCKPLTPKIVLTVPPDHGSICARDIIRVVKLNVVSDDQSCVGKRVQGLQVIYLASSDYAGHDTVDYNIEFPHLVRTTHAEIEVRPGNQPALPRLDEESVAPGKAGDVVVACSPLSS
jgi:hypothetical protein